jgi:hypothetical protein
VTQHYRHIHFTLPLCNKCINVTIFFLCLRLLYNRSILRTISTFYELLNLRLKH